MTRVFAITTATLTAIIGVLVGVLLSVQRSAQPAVPMPALSSAANSRLAASL